MTDQQLQLVCQQMAIVCTSRKFRKLNKEMVKLYRKKGISDPHVVAFQDCLFSLYLEQFDRNHYSQSERQ